MLRIKDNHNKSKLLFDYFVDGLEEELSKSDEEILMSIKKTLKDTIQWNEHTDDVAMIASHNCSDMLINIGKRHQNESYYEGPTAKSD